MITNGEEIIKSKIQQLYEPSHSINASPGFSQKVMSKIYECENRKKTKQRCIAAGFWFLPFFAREMWNLVRNDYFSVSTLPVGDKLASLYQMTMTTTFSYSLLTLGIVMASLALIKMVKMKNQNPARRLV